MSDNRKKSKAAVVRENWSSFRTFLYNSETKTVLGRGSESWTKIIAFYVLYYGILAALFAISIALVLSSLDEHTPRYQTRLQTPGVAVQPKIPSDEDQTSDIRFSLKRGDMDAQKLIAIVDKFLKPYAPKMQTNTTLFKNCSLDTPTDSNQTYGPGDIAQACTFDVTQLGPCMTSPYGYDIFGSPCIYVKVNRIIGWRPVRYTNLEQAVGNKDSGAPPLHEVLSTNGKQYKPHLMYTACYGVDEKDSDKVLIPHSTNLNGGDNRSIKYYPSDNGFASWYYPYLGKLRQPRYLSPLVAVQFTNVTRNVAIRVHCKVYARNIRDNKDMGEGFFTFRLEVKDPSSTAGPGHRWNVGPITALLYSLCVHMIVCADRVW